MTPPDEQFRAIGFTDEAANYPRDDLALAMFAAFNGVTVEQLPEAMRYFPNEATARAWKRVADATRAYHADICREVGHQGGNDGYYNWPVHCADKIEGYIVDKP